MSDTHAAPGGHGHTTGEDITVLLVEDDRLNQLFLRRLLEKLGHTVVVAGNGREAVELHGTHTFDCILMDIQMPVMSGVEATEAIRRTEAEARGTRIPIIAVTAHTLPGDRQRFLEAGMDECVGKPVLVGKLLQVLQGVLNRNLKGAGGGGLP